jgi:glutathione synthase/RimK-type ligase-like ATP-grasp enzyme
LSLAKKVGFRIPDTLITNKKEEVLSFFNSKQKGIIAKAVGVGIPIKNIDGYHYYQIVFTKKLTINILSENLDSIRFCPSIFQEYIEKDIEIRTFFVDNEYYSMAIFSQNDNKTAIDYRNYNVEKPNRNVPFELPNEILLKLKKFAKKINCTTGSIDLILNKDSEFIFLEINPMGQYHWLSENCNYYIDKKIAEILIEKSNEY